MATIIPINLSQVCHQVLRVIALYPPVPVIQNNVVGSSEANPTPAKYTRDESILSFGFPVSRDVDAQVLNFVSGNSTVYNNNVFPIPVNTYVTVKPSQVYRSRNVFSDDSNFSVFLLDVSVCPIEPGFSRLRVDYTADLGNGQFKSITDYLDMPFWEGWDTHPREIQEIVDFSEQSIDFIQEEINFVNQSCIRSSSRQLMRGLIVSGTMATTQSNATIPTAPFLTPTGIVAPHLMPNTEKLSEIFSEMKEINQAKAMPGTNVYNILNIQPNNVYGGETLTITLDSPAISNEVVYMASVPLPTVVNGNVLTVTVPSYLTYAFTIGIQIGSSKAPKSSSYLINVLAKPVINKITGISEAFVTRGGSFVIQGSGFGNKDGLASITILPNSVATVSSWTDTTVIGTFPALVDTGFVTLTTETGKTATFGVNSLPYVSTDSLIISPGISTVTSGNTVQFSATLNSMAVSGNWSLETLTGNIDNGNEAYGRINSAGLYTAPNGFTGSLQLKVVFNVMTLHGSNSTSAALVVTSVASSYTLSPASISLQPSITQQFQLFNGTTLIQNSLQWYVNGILGGSQTLGFVSTSGIYQAPSSPPPTGTVSISSYAANGFGIAGIQLLSTNSLNSKIIPIVIIGGDGIYTPPTSINPINPTPIGTPVAQRTAPSTVNTPHPQIQLGTIFKATLSCSGTINPTPTIPGSIVCTSIAKSSIYAGATNGNFDGSIYTPIRVEQNVILSTTCSGTYSDGSVVDTSCIQAVDVIPASLPVPFISKIDSVCPGKNAVVTGTNFPSDAQIKFASNNQTLQIVSAPSSADNTNYTMTIQIPSSLSASAFNYPIYLASATAGNSNTINFTVPNSCLVPVISASLAISPSNLNVTQGINGQQSQFSASLQFSNNTSQDVTSQAQWYVNGILGGNATYGTISANGLYTSVSSRPSNEVEKISAVYNYNNSQLSSNASVTYIAPALAPPPTPATPPTALPADCVIILVQPSFQKIFVPGPQIQFTAHQTINGASDTAIRADKWFVNGIQGGNTVYGFVDVNGLYTPPTYYAPSNFVETTVAAQYNSLSGYSVMQYVPVKPTTVACVISTVNQINIDFGDNRVGFIPAGTSDYLLIPGNYLLTVYMEYLDLNMRPINVGSAQTLTYSQVNAKANNLAVMIYNEGAIQKDFSGLAAYTRPRTVVLGICDPNSGYFQSKWDLVRVINPINNIIAPSPTNCLPHSMPATLTNHVEQKLIDFKETELDNAQYMFTGSALFVKNVLEFTTPLHLIRFNAVENSLQDVEIKTKKITVQNEKFVFAYEKNNKFVLKTLNLGDTLPKASHIYIVGVNLGKFYSVSPFFQVKSQMETSALGDKSIRLGDMLIQWGCSTGGTVLFPQKFTTDYTLNVNAIITNKDANGFTFTIIDKEEVNWFAVGS